MPRHLAARRGSLVVVTHDRWFLDAVVEQTWEVANGGVRRYEGGYAAYVLARAERERLERVADERRRNLVRKELAWLRRGPPARTSKPRFRIEAANALIAEEPPAAIEGLKRLTAHALTGDLASGLTLEHEVLGALYRSDIARERIRAFAEKSEQRAGGKAGRR